MLVGLFLGSKPKVGRESLEPPSRAERAGIPPPPAASLLAKRTIPEAPIIGPTVG
jgi:hypothetical protein